MSRTKATTPMTHVRPEPTDALPLLPLYTLAGMVAGSSNILAGYPFDTGGSMIRCMEDEWVPCCLLTLPSFPGSNSNQPAPPLPSPHTACNFNPMYSLTPLSLRVAWYQHPPFSFPPCSAVKVRLQSNPQLYTGGAWRCFTSILSHEGVS
jgi:hypothetical protein